MKLFKFKLIGVKTAQFAILPEHYDDDAEVDMETGFSMTVGSDERILGMFFEIKFKQENTFMLLEAGCHFEIPEDAWNEMLDDEDILVVPKEFLHHLGVLAVGTSRGILHTKTEGTPFNQYFIPVVDITEMITEDLRVSPEEND